MSNFDIILQVIAACKHFQADLRFVFNRLCYLSVLPRHAKTKKVIQLIFTRSGLKSKKCKVNYFFLREECSKRKLSVRESKIKKKPFGIGK